jgi:hypothetical protein
MTHPVGHSCSAASHWYCRVFLTIAGKTCDRQETAILLGFQVMCRLTECLGRGWKVEDGEEPRYGILSRMLCQYTYKTSGGCGIKSNSNARAL